MKKTLLISGCLIYLLSLTSCTIDEVENQEISADSVTTYPPPVEPQPLPPTYPPHGDDDQDKDKTKP